ncbi:hypothetical protein HPP92_018798 [Vanilla planifolia]|uniref:Thioredoxin domain-containing protein n=1 Tax=Vanilla planifolia TaxID=51239 RepID=A0A835UIR3_VANPL|nr:hypothetical protein HPP92_019363 [Vanilla planifolia]KAG0464634.1 hypothetical protein HPP92_018798 [Vanilla planifolia]
MATSYHVPLCLRSASYKENETPVSPYHQRKTQNSFFLVPRGLYRCSSQHIWTRSFLSFEEKRRRRKLSSNSGRVSCNFLYGPELVTACSWNELVLCSDVPVVVEFWASWCGPCKMVSRLVNEMACEYSGRIRCLRIDVDQYPQIAASPRC